MRLTFVNDLGQNYEIEVDPQMELENIMALLEAESGIPVAEQSISMGGRELNNPRATIYDCGVRDDSVLLFRRKVTVAGQTAEQDAEMMRLQILGDPLLMEDIRHTQPELADAIIHNPPRFSEHIRQLRRRQNELEYQRQREIELLNADPFDVEAQRRIEEAIRQQAVLENMEHAIEYSPESFGRVTMLYIPVEVNSHPVKAFVDSGAQQTIMSPECAEACGIMRLVDRRFSGIARGVGTARILGRVHSAQLKLDDLHLACSFTIMEGRDVDLLFGLDMLKAHQAIIDLQKNVLRIQGREVKFLAEHELPEGARQNSEIDESTAGSSTESPQPNSRQFPSISDRNPTAQPSSSSSGFPESKIKTLTDLGASREEAINLLREADGNLEYAASLLF